MVIGDELPHCVGVGKLFLDPVHLSLNRLIAVENEEQRVAVAQAVRALPVGHHGAVLRQCEVPEYIHGPCPPWCSWLPRAGTTGRSPNTLRALWKN